MNVYAESSAVLAWLLDEPSAPAVRRLLGGAEAVVASNLTLIECDRVLLRAVVLKELTAAEAADRRAHLIAAAAHWHVLRIADEVVDRSRQPFPGDPIRTLDAIHLASLLVARSAVAGLRLLSLDERVRQTAKRLGIAVEPA
ncbi:MAG: type II toxin-antitoxin system VapC family toxin [Gammaproteobacteria bacterium]|nr:type II toxin-antitoxin system VapC family toxin [Gammaproteobacteria bacterium]